MSYWSVINKTCASGLHKGVLLYWIAASTWSSLYVIFAYRGVVNDPDDYVVAIRKYMFQ
jgi:hypothetical protein